MAAFVALEAAALVLYLVVGRDQWFFSDEWDYLAARDLTDPDDLLRPHNEHWHTIPIVVLRLLWAAFGLRTYLPYQLLVVVLHLAAAALLRVAMRRAGVGPLVATVAAGVFVLFGAGAENIVFAVQITFVGSLVLGLAQLLLADHDGPLDRRDALGVLAGLGALMCSGVGVAMVGTVGVAALVRRGWRAAAWHTLPLAGAYLLWWATYGRSSPRGGTVGTVARFVAAGLDAAFDALGQRPQVAAALVVVLVAGLAVAWAGLRGAELRRRASLPAAMLAGAVGFLVVSGVGRAGVFGAESARETRYFPLVVALVLPALAVAVDALWRRWWPAGAVATVVLVAGVPGNLAALSDLEGRAVAVAQARQLLLALPHVPLAPTAPADLRPLPEWYHAPDVTMGWLVEGAREGWLPDPGPIDGATARAATFRLSLHQVEGEGEPQGCRPLDGPVEVHLAHGEALAVEGGFVRVSRAGPGATPEEHAIYNPNRGDELVAIAGDLDLRVESAGRNGIAALCDPPAR